MDLSNKVAVVTGGASGLGRAAAQELSDRGAILVIIDMNAEAGTRAVEELGADKTHFISLDVSNGPDVEAAFDKITGDLGRVDVCVNCAGIGIAAKTIDREGNPHNLDHYRKVIEVNLVGTFNISRCAAAAMARNEPDEKTERGVMATPLMLGAPQQVQDGIVSGIPFPKRLGEPAEIGQLVVHMVENSYLNGETIRLDGAVRMQPR